MSNLISHITIVIIIISLTSLTFSRIKPGTNNVKLLNSAVINKFTMLTYRQPLTGKDRLVVDILPVRELNTETDS